MQGINWNPWTVSCLEDFLFYCCPECNQQNKEREIFLHHVLDQHPIAKEFICDVVKIENYAESKTHNLHGHSTQTAIFTYFSHTCKKILFLKGIMI